jgi:acetate kinase
VERPLMDGAILTINSGSSSLKFGLYAQQEGRERILFAGTADRIGKEQGKLSIKDADGRTVFEEATQYTSHPHAFVHGTQQLKKLSGTEPSLVGHRVVHGGPHLREHQRITPAVLKTLQASIHFAPLHIPSALELIRQAEKLFPNAAQFACFDTAFHSTLPVEASTYALPKQYRDAGVTRYGFHGLSYESVVEALAPNVPSRIIVAHLGNGASVCAIADGLSVDTSMGMTPTGGVPMGTRSGDLDPGIVLFLARTAKFSTDQLESLLNHESGLAGLSGGTSDMRTLSASAAGGNSDAQLAINIFCRSIAKTIGAYSAVLRGVDLVVFTGGIGEHSAEVRAQVCAPLRHLGIVLDGQKNQAGNPLISETASPCAVCIVTADEDGQIARHVRRLAQVSSAERAPLFS